VRDLNGELCLPVRAAEPGDAPQCRLVRIAVEAGAPWGDPPYRLDVGHLEAQERRARVGQHSQMREVPVGHRAVHGGILAHGGHHDAVLEREAAEVDRLEKGAHREEDLEGV
jgi:hypothetical protein